MRYTRRIVMILLASLCAIVTNAQTNRIYTPDVIMSKGSETSLSIFMDNTESVTAVEFSIELPSGFTLTSSSAILSDRAKNHQITVKKLSNGKYKFLVMSQSNALIEGIAGELITIRLKSNNNVTDEGDYHIVISDAVMSAQTGENVLEEAVGSKITIKSMPNLHVISIDCSEPIAGRQVTVKWKVRNDGRGSTGDTQWKDYVWLVPNISAGTSMTGSKLLATVDNIAALASGESYENTVNITLDERVYGNYDLVVTSNMYGANKIDFSSTGGTPPIPYDPENGGYGYLKAQGDSHYVTVEEENEYNGKSDNFFYKRIEIQVPPLADIQVPKVVVNVDNSDYVKGSDGTLGLSADYTGIGTNYLIACAVLVSGTVSNTAFYSGKKVRVTATIKNMGGAEIPETNIKNQMFISNTPDLNGDKVYLLGSSNENISLKAGASTNVVLTGYIPIDWYGDAYFIVAADVNDAVYELANTENNYGSTGKVNVLLTPGPDFVPYNLSVPNNISTGTSFDINYFVKNSGPGSPYVKSWKDRVYISSKNTGLDDSAVCIGEFTRTGTYQKLAILEQAVGFIVKYDGDAYNHGYTVKLDQGMPSGTYYIYVKVDADNDVFEYDGEDNNVIMSKAITLASPDLTVEVVDISEETISTDDKVAVTWRLKNIGTADIQNASVTDVFNVSSNADGSESLSLGSATNTVSIAAGGEKILRTNITIPRNTSLNGTRYFFIKTNTKNTVKETNTNNNTSVAVAKQFVYVEDPTQLKINGTNLTVSSLKVASSVRPGAEINLSYQIKNTGSYAIDKEVKQEIFISKNDYYDNSARVLTITGSYSQVKGLASGQTVTTAVKATIPNDMIGGQYYILVYVNRDKILVEKKNDDNHQTSPIYLNGNQPNLVVNNVEMAGSVKTSVSTPVKWTLSNTGTWDASSVTCGIYVSSDATWSDDDQLLGSVKSSKLAPNSTLEMSANIEVPDDIVGQNYIIVKADKAEEEVNTNDNTKSKRFTSIQSQLPDLEIFDISYENVWRGGQSVVVKAKVRNIGDDITHKDKWTDLLYLSEGYTLDVNEAIKLGSKTHVGKLDKDGMYELSITINIPTNLKGYYVLFALTDGTNAMVEKNKENNRANITVYVEDKNDRPSDLVVNRISSPARIIAGEPVTISYTLANNGEYAATGTLRDVLYLSKDATWDKDDVMVGVVTDDIDLAPGNESVRTITGRISNIPEGSYYLVVRTNSTHAIAESDYDNNTTVQQSISQVEFATLNLGSTITVNTSGIYKMPLNGMDGKTVGVYLTTPEDASAGLYSSYEQVPSTAHYERASTKLEQTEQEVLIPNVQDGTYYILAQDNAAMTRSLIDFSEGSEGGNSSGCGNIFSRIIFGSFVFYPGNTLPSESTTTMTLTAREVQFGATSLSITEGGTNGWISTEIHGALLDSIMDFRLTQGDVMIPAESITFYDQTSTKASFNLNDAETGMYDVVSELPDGTQASLPNGFRVVPGTNVALGVKLDAPAETRGGGYAPVNVAYANGGNTDIVIRELLLVIRGGYLSKTIEGFDEKLTELHIKPDVKQDNRGFVIIPPGMQETVNYYFKQDGGQASSTISLYIVK